MLGLALIVGPSSVFAQNTGSAAANKSTIQAIEQAWKSSPEFKRFNELGGEKSDEALQLREKTIKRIAGESLRPFIEGFDERIRERNRQKVASYPSVIQAMIAYDYELGFPLIKDKSQRNLNRFNGGLLTYIDNVYNGTGKAEQAAEILLKKFPEFDETEFQAAILERGKNIDIAARSIAETLVWEEIIRKLCGLSPEHCRSAQPTK